MTRRIALVLATTAFALVFAACGGDAKSGSETRSGSLAPSQTPTGKGTAIVQADLSSANSPQDAIETLEQVIQDRLGDVGVITEISQTSDAEITIHYSQGYSPDFVKQVIEAQNLNFRQPIITAGGGVKCGDESGSEFSVPVSGLHEARDDLGNAVEACVAANGQPGALEWQPAQADVNGESKTLSQAMIDPDKVEISNAPQGTVVVIRFDTEGAGVFAALTARLVNYPLGIFLGDTLLTAPTVQSAINSGEAQITGVSDDDLAAAKAVIKGGELPVPVTVTSIELDSPAP
jgi:preprotein translocase subunit SecD